MRKLTPVVIKYARVSRLGLTIQLNKSHKRVWHIVPGSLIRQNQQRFSRLVIPGVYDLSTAITMLNALPLVNKRIVLDLHTDVPVEYTRTYRKRSYTPHGDVPLAPTKRSINQPINPVFVIDQNGQHST